MAKPKPDKTTNESTYHPVTANCVIVRTYSAGVHYGTLHSHDGREVVLLDCRRIWSWKGANTLHEASQNGIDPAGSKVSIRIPTITLTEAIEVIPCSQVAVDRIEACKW